MLFRSAFGKICRLQLGRKIEFLRPESNWYGISHLFLFAPVVCAVNTFSSQTTVVDADAILASIAHQPNGSKRSSPDCASVLDDLKGLGFEQEIIDSLACLPRESFSVEWKKIQLLLSKGVHPTEVRTLVMPSKSPRKLRFTNVPYAKLASVLKILENIDLSEKCPIKALTLSPLLKCSVKQLQSRLDLFDSMGLGQGMSKLLFRRPSFILNISSTGMAERLNAIKAIGMDEKDLLRIVRKFPKILLYKFDSSIIPKLEYLEKLGVSKKAILKFLIRVPSVGGVSTETIAKKVEVLQELGIGNCPDRLLTALSYLCSFRCETILGRADWFKSRGFSSEDVSEILVKFPVVFQKSEKELDMRISYLEDVLKRDKKEALTFPIYLVCSFEDRIVYRFNILRDKGLLNSRMTLGFVLSRSNEGFDELITKLENPKHKERKTRI